jgi:uncharacterized lipoprotein YajG
MASAMASAAQAARGELILTLRFTPTSATYSEAPALPSTALARTLTVEVADERAISDRSIVGEGTDDDDTRFPVKADNDVAELAREVIPKLASGWGMRTAPRAERTLVVTVVKWFATEANQAVGSMYTTEVVLRGELRDATGRTLWRAVGSGDTRRYGKKQSSANYNETFSDAAQEALADLLSDGDLHVALEKGTPGPVVAAGIADAVSERSNAPVVADAPMTLLYEVKELLKKSFSEKFLLDFVRGKTYQRPMTTDDLIAWKDAGIPERVIQAAYERSGAGGR